MKWTLVTGAAKGLGASICEELAKNGHNIVVHYRNSAYEAEKIVGLCRHYKIQAQSIQGDFSSADNLQDFIIRYNQSFSNTINLVNNVGNYLVKNATETDLDEWQSLMQTNFTAPFAITKALLPSIITNQGSIVNIGMAGINNQKAETYAFAYTLSKKSLFELTKSFAKELSTDNVSVNMVSPGYLTNSVDKPISTSALPMQRLADLTEVARLVSFLLDPKNRYITGQNIEVAGAVRL